MTDPLGGRICKDLLVAGVLNPDGSLPVCLGERCSHHEICLADLLVCQQDIGDAQNLSTKSEICRGCLCVEKCRQVLVHFWERKYGPDRKPRFIQETGALIMEAGPGMNCMGWRKP